MLATAFILGLMGSLHCIGMCGPIAFMLPLDRRHTALKYGQLGMYHLGRALAYGLIGLVMIASVLIPSRYFRGWKLTRPLYRLIGRLQGALGSQLRRRSPDTFLTIGFLNGFLPCGLVYMALIGAMALASAPQGALYMVVFGLGTLPLMSAAALFGKFIKGRWAPALRRAIPAFVVLIGLLFILRGMGLGIPYLSPKMKPQAVTTSVDCHPQE